MACLGNLVLDDYGNSGRGQGRGSIMCACVRSPSPLSPTPSRERRENSGTAGSMNRFFLLPCSLRMRATRMETTPNTRAKEKPMTPQGTSFASRHHPFRRDLCNICSFFHPAFKTVLCTDRYEGEAPRLSPPLLRCRSALYRI